MDLYILLILAMATGAGILWLGYWMGRMDRESSRVDQLLAGPEGKPDQKKKEEPPKKRYDDY